MSVGGFNNKNNNHDASQAPFVWGKFLRGKITDENNNKSTFLFTTQNSRQPPSGRIVTARPTTLKLVVSSPSPSPPLSFLTTREVRPMIMVASVAAAAAAEKSV